MAETDPRQRAFYQGLLGLGAGILGANAPTRYPGGGTQALGVGIQQGLQSYNNALTMEDKLEALRQERALRGQLTDALPEIIEEAREMGVNENLLKSAELTGPINPSSALNMVQNAMVKIQKRPTEKVTYRDPFPEESAQTPGLFKIQENQDGTVAYLDRNMQPLKSFVKEKPESLPASSPFSTEFVGFPNKATPVMDPLNPENILGYNMVTSPGKVEFKTVEQLRDKSPEQEPSKTGPHPELGHTITIPNSTDMMVHMGDGKFERSKKEEVKTTKEKAGFKYIKKGDENFPTNAPAGADEVQLSPTNERTYFKDGFKMEAPKVKDLVKPFEYVDGTEAEFTHPELFKQMGENDVLEVNPETGKASILVSPGVDSEDIDYREILSSDGKTLQQGYYSKSTGKLVTDLGTTPVKLDKGLETKDKLKFLVDRHKKPADRLQAMVSNYESISTAVGAGKPFDDLALIFYIAKMLDPTSVVREGEQMIIRNTGALPDKFLNYFQRLQTGKAFTKDQRKDILGFAKRKMDAELKTYNQVVGGVKRDSGPKKFNLGYEDTVVPALGIIHDKMDTNKTYDKIFKSIEALKDINDDDLNTDGDSGLKKVVIKATSKISNKLGDALDQSKSQRPSEVLTNEKADSILD